MNVSNLRLSQLYCSATGPDGHPQQRLMTPEEFDATWERVPMPGSLSVKDSHGGQVVSGPGVDLGDEESVSVRRCKICKRGYLMSRPLT